MSTVQVPPPTESFEFSFQNSKTSFLEELFMGINKDQVEGRVKEAAGKVQEAAGKTFGSTAEEAKGLAKQVEGKTQAKLGDAKETVKEHVRDADKGKI